MAASVVGSTISGVSNVGRKRKTAAADMATKKQALGDSFAAIAAEDEEKEELGDIMGLVKSLLAKPEKIKAALVAATGTAHQQQQVQQTFPSTYIYISRIPKEWLTKSTLPKMCQRLTPEVLASLCKQERRVDQKLLVMGGGHSLQTKIWSHHKGVFDDKVVAYHTGAMNSILDTVEWDDDTFSINWQLSGLFIFMPPKPANVLAKDHIYTHIRCKVLPESCWEVIRIVDSFT